MFDWFIKKIKGLNSQSRENTMTSIQTVRGTKNSVDWQPVRKGCQPHFHLIAINSFTWDLM